MLATHSFDASEPLFEFSDPSNDPRNQPVTKVDERANALSLSD
jgi:hypothetical protein